MELIDQIRLEYVRSTISQRAVAEKYGVSPRMVMQRAQRERWFEERRRYRERTIKKALTKGVNRDSGKLSRLMSAADSMAQVIENVYKDADQFNRFIGQKSQSTPGEGSTSQMEERVFQKFDTKAIRDMTAAIKDLVLTMRNLYDLPTVQEKSAMDIAAERLALEKLRTPDPDEDDKHTGIAMLPPVMDEPDEEEA